MWTGFGMYGLVLGLGFLFSPLQNRVDAFIQRYEVIDAMGYHLYAYLFVSVVALLAFSVLVTLGMYPIGRKLEAHLEEENRRKDLWREIR